MILANRVPRVVGTKCADVRQLQPMSEFVNHPLQFQIDHDIVAEFGLGIDAASTLVEITNGPAADLFTEAAKEGVGLRGDPD